VFYEYFDSRPEAKLELLDGRFISARCPISNAYKEATR